MNLKFILAPIIVSLSFSQPLISKPASKTKKVASKDKKNASKVEQATPNVDNNKVVSDSYLTDTEEASKDPTIEPSGKTKDLVLQAQASRLQTLSQKFYNRHFELGFSGTAPVLFLYNQLAPDLLYSKLFGFGANAFFRLKADPSEKVPRFLVNVGYDHFGGFTDNSPLRSERVIAGIGAEWVFSLNHFFLLSTSLTPGISYQVLRRTEGTIASLRTANFDFIAYFELGGELKVAHNLSLTMSIRTTASYRFDSISVTVQPLVGIIIKFF